MDVGKFIWKKFPKQVFFYLFTLWEIRVVKKCSITLEINKNLLCEERQTTAVNETPNEESRDATGVTLQVDFNWIPLDTGEWEKVNKLNYSLSFSIWIKTKTKWLFISGSSDSGNIFFWKQNKNKTSGQNVSRKCFHSDCHRRPPAGDSFLIDEWPRTSTRTGRPPHLPMPRGLRSNGTQQDSFVRSR